MSITKLGALWFHAALFAVALAVGVGLAALGGPVVEGQNAWIKPSKFALSFAVHLATLALIVRWTGVDTPLFRWTAFAVIATAWFEFALIAIQAARGVRSHFNVETPVDAAIFTMMGVGIGVLFFASIAMAVAVWRAQADRTWAMTVAAVAILAGAVGSLTAMPMVTPTPEQIAGFDQGIRISSGGRYPDGVAPSGVSVPIVGWSLEHGDWRVAHFLGVHALQALLLWGWLVQGLRAPARNMSFLTGLAAYAAVTLIAMWAARANLGPLTIPPDVFVALAVCAAAPVAAALVSWSVYRSAEN